MTTHQRMHLLVPTLTIVAVLAYAIVTIAGPRPDSIPAPAPPPPAFAGTKPVDADTLEIWLDLTKDGLHTREDLEVTAAGISRNGQWGYLALGPATPGAGAARDLLFRTKSKQGFGSWRSASYTDLKNVRWRTCDRKPPPEIQRLLERDRFRCES